MLAKVIARLSYHYKYDQMMCNTAMLSIATQRLFEIHMCLSKRVAQLIIKVVHLIT